MDDASSSGIDSANPSSKEDFDKLREAINNKVQDFSKAEPFADFVTELVQSMVVNCKYCIFNVLIPYNVAMVAPKKKKIISLFLCSSASS